MTRPLLFELAEPHFWHREPMPWWWLHERVHLHTLRSWERVSAETRRTGEVEALHSIRDSYQGYLLGTLKLLDGYSMLAGLFGDEFGPPRAELVERLNETREQLQKHYDTLFPKWQTLDDLEDILLASITPPNAVLLEMAQRFPPPQSWFEETIDPFEPAEGSPS